MNMMKKLFIFSVFLPLWLSGATLVVDANPSCWPFMGCSSCEAGFMPDNPYTKIQDAVNDASSGDTISICDATYDEEVVIDNWKNNLTIKKSDKASGDVLVKNTKTVFTIDAIDGLTMDSIKIEQTSDKGAVSINSYSKNILFKNLNIKANEGDAIATGGDNGKFELKNSILEAGNNGIDFNDKINDGVFISDTTINASDKGICANDEISGGITILDTNITTTNGYTLEFDENINGGFTMNNSIINSNGYGVYFKKVLNDGLSISHTKITSNKESLEFTKKVNGGINIENSSINSGDDGIDLNEELNSGLNISDTNITASNNGFEAEKINNGLNISKVNIQAGQKGFEFNGELNDNVVMSNLTISAIDDALYFKEKINSGITINSSEINSTSAISIDFKNDVYNSCNIDDVTINSKGRGLYFNNKQIPANITNSNIKSSDDAIYTKNNNGSKFTLKDSCVESKANGKNALWINNQSTNAEVSGNCFYATSVEKLAKAGKDGNDVSANYWDGLTTATYDNNKVLDSTPLSKCNLSCGVNTASQCNKIATPATTSLEFEGAEITLNKSRSKPHWTHIDFQKSFSSVPIVFILPTADGSHPASIRMKNISTTGFDAVFAEPQGEDGPHIKQDINYLAVNKGVHKINNTYIQVGSVDTQKYQTGDWEDVSIIDKFKCDELVVVAQIQSLANETGLADENGNTIKVSKPFLTTAIKADIGVHLALERSETTDGTISSDETIGYMIAQKNIKDEVVDDNGNKVKFQTIKKDDYFEGWDDSCKEVNFGNGYNTSPLVAANKNTKNEADGGWFRRCSLNKDKIGLKIDEDRSQDKERSHIAESGSIFAFSGNILIRENNNKKISFDAWDTFRDITDRNISTKIASQDFDITIASLNETGNDYQEFSGTVCTCIDDVNCFKNYFVKNNTSSQTTQGNPTFNLSDATKEAKVYIHWKKDVDESCPLVDETGNTIAPDSFAIRPNAFEMTVPSSTIYAGENFAMSFYAKDDSSADTAKYDEQKDTTFVLESNIIKDGCNKGTLTLNPEPFNFTDGKKENVDVVYTNIGDLNITIKEKDDCNLKFGAVDCDDKNVSNSWNSSTDLFIKPYSKVITIKPYEINVTVADMNASTGVDWLYMADVGDMNLSLFGEVKAFNKQGVLLEDFNSSCYAVDTDIDMKVNTENTPNIDINYSIAINDNFTSVTNSNISDINKTITITASDFDGGKANVSYVLNVDRNFSKPTNPFNLKDLNVSVASTGISKKVNSKTDNSNFIFYYGRVIAKDIKTTDENVNHEAEIEVYDNSESSYVSGFQRNTLNWYRNEKHTDVKYGNITLIDARDSDVSVTTPTIKTDGKLDFTISNSTSNTYDMHIKTQEWLFYNPYATSFDNSSTSNCTQHPCFKYTLKSSDNSTAGIKSGNFSGTDYNVEGRGDYERTGVKVFR